MRHIHAKLPQLTLLALEKTHVVEHLCAVLLLILGRLCKHLVKVPRKLRHCNTKFRCFGAKTVGVSLCLCIFCALLKLSLQLSHLSTQSCSRVLGS